MKVSSIIAGAAVAAVVALQAWTLNEVVALKVAVAVVVFFVWPKIRRYIA